MRPLRSVLYVPASKTGALAKMRTLPCDAIIIDLEDAVAPEAKTAARATAVAEVAAGGFGRQAIAVRANALETAWGAGDFEAASVAPVDAIVVPKVETPEQAADAVAAVRGRPVWAMIETPLGVLQVDRIAAVPGVAALIAGHSDLAKDLRAKPDRDRTELSYALHRLLYAARAYGLVALDGVHGDIRDLETLERTCRQGAALGYDGRTIVHPDHIAITNRAYSPDPAAVEHARGLIAAYAAAGIGATTYRGRMVERLHVEEAERLVAFAEAIEGAD